MTHPLGIQGHDPTVRTPGKSIYLDPSQALSPDVLSDRILIVANKTSSGTAMANQIVEVPADSYARSYFGSGSLASNMCIAVRKQYRYARLYCMPMADADGTPAAGQATCDGAGASAAGTFTGKIHNQSFRVAVPKDMTKSELAAAIVAATTAAKMPDLMLTTAVNGVDDYKIDFTAKNDGTPGNWIDISGEFNEGFAGLTFTVNTPMASGATNPSLDDVDDVIIAAKMSDLLVVPWEDETNYAKWKELQAAMAEPRSHFFSLLSLGSTDTYGNASTLAGNLNFPLNSMVWCEKTATHPAELAAYYAAAIASKTNPALDLDGVELPYVDPPKPHDLPSDTVIENCLKAGITPLTVNDRGVACIVRAISTHLTTDSEEDTRFLDIQPLRVFQRHQREWTSMVNTIYGTPEDRLELAADTDELRIHNLKLARDKDIARDRKNGYLRNVDLYKDKFTVDELDGGGTLSVLPTPCVPRMHQFWADLLYLNG